MLTPKWKWKTVWSYGILTGFQWGRLLRLVSISLKVSVSDDLGMSLNNQLPFSRIAFPSFLVLGNMDVCSSRVQIGIWLSDTMCFSARSPRSLYMVKAVSLFCDFVMASYLWVTLVPIPCSQTSQIDHICISWGTSIPQHVGYVSGLRERGGAEALARQSQTAEAMQAWLPAPQLWSSSLTQGAIQLGATQLSHRVVGSSDSDLWAGPAETSVCHPQPFILFPSLANFRSRLPAFFLGNLVNTGEEDTCVWAQHGYQDYFNGTEAAGHWEFEHLHRSQSNTRAHAHRSVQFLWICQVVFHRQHRLSIPSSLVIIRNIMCCETVWIPSTRTGNLWECPLIWVNHPQRTSYQSTSN